MNDRWPNWRLVAPAITAFSALAAIVSCDGSGDPEPQVLAGLELHEMATFTSLQGSDGVAVAGVQSEEGALPGDLEARATALWPDGVFQQLQRPVVYVHAPHALSLRVDVTAPRGAFAAWLPGADRVEPPVDEAAPLQGGELRWRVDVSPNSWAASGDAVADRLLEASDVSLASRTSEAAPYLTYRGFAALDELVRVEVAEDGMVTVDNHTDHPIPAAFLMHVHEFGGALVELGRIEARGRGDASLLDLPTPKETDPSRYRAVVSERVAEAAADQGLTEAEAAALVATWDRGVFATRGYRVLFLVPAALSSHAATLSSDPIASTVTRVHVGRVEILRPKDEAAILSAVRDVHEGASLDAAIAGLGFLAQAKLRRALALIDADPASHVDIRPTAVDLLAAARALQQ